MKLLFTPMPLIGCQKLDWLKGLGMFQISDKPDIVFRWEYPHTIFKPVDPSRWGVRVVNNHCLNVTKRWLNRVFEEVYGYSLEENSGWAVEKPNLTNGFKDVRLVNLDEQPKREGYFYQKRLNEDGEVKECRVVIMNFKPVLMNIKTKQVSKEDLVGKITDYEISELKDDNLERFCRLIGLDYGEVDMIDGKVIDVNPTPGDALFVNMPIKQAVDYLGIYIELFKKYYHA
jgi:hypothetical protein